MAYVALSGKPIGSIVKLKESGTLVDYIVVHQGQPPSMYDASCNGTWLLRKEIAENRQWNSFRLNDYGSSTIHSYLNSTFLNRFDASIRNVVNQANIPYMLGGRDNEIVPPGDNYIRTVPCKVFLLSGNELGWTDEDSRYFPGDGEKLAYFEGGKTTSANNKRIAYLGGGAAIWWLRSRRFVHGTEEVWNVSIEGNFINNRYSCLDSYGIRPALILPSSLVVIDDGSVTTNTAPSIPASISVPGSINGGTTITISWGGSGDAENNLAGYIAERSTDGGSTWGQIYQGGNGSTTNFVAFGTGSVIYRVKAYDTQGLHSGYRTGSLVTAINNVAPGAPASINVPLVVEGGKALALTWSTAGDSDGNLAGYCLERSVNSGGYTEIFRGNATGHTDTITKGWATVAYRVRTYDSYMAYSAYTTSAIRTVNNNTPPAINYSGSTALGNKTEGFTVAYSVSDADGNPVTVTEKLDGTVNRTHTPGLGTSQQLQAVLPASFQQILNGNHTLTLEATDGKAAATPVSLTFTKAVYRCSVTLSTPLPADTMPEAMRLTITGSIPSDAIWTAQVCNNGKDASPTWENIKPSVVSGYNYVFSNQVKTADAWGINFRIEIQRGASNIGGHIYAIEGGFR